MMKQLGIAGNLAALIPPYVVFGLPFQIFVMRGFFRTVPSELLEAARLDGASEWGIFWRILMPLSAPALATLFIIDALATWNELLIALVLIQRIRMAYGTGGPSAVPGPVVLALHGDDGRRGDFHHPDYPYLYFLATIHGRRVDGRRTEGIANEPPTPSDAHVYRPFTNRQYRAAGDAHDAVAHRRGSAVPIWPRQAGGLKYRPWTRHCRGGTLERIRRKCRSSRFRPPMTIS